MSPQIATVLCTIGILGLFLLHRDRKARTSKALWLPVVWLSIGASRAVSAWLEAIGFVSSRSSIETPDQLLEGSPLDRYLLTAFIAIGVVVLFRRGHRVGEVLRRNVPILVFFLYCGLSTLWSDYPDVSFKRWTKSLGDLVIVLIVLTDSDPLAAVKRLLARLAFFLMPTSVLLVKYFPDLGRAYNPFTGESSYTGVTLNKNILGCICLLFGAGSVWRILEAVRGGPDTRRSGPLVAHGAVLSMVMWLFFKANSMTSFSCFLMATTLMVAMSFSVLSRRRWFVHLLVVTMLAVACSALFLDFGSGLVHTMGRDPTLTGRTEIWSLVLGMSRSSLLGTGYDSFWLGRRLEKIWSLYWWHPREAHDGYIDVFLNLGWVGLTLLAVVLVTGYRNIVVAFGRDSWSGSLKLAYFVSAVAYNFTESAFGMMNPIWIFFLLATVIVPGGWVRIQLKRAESLTVTAPPIPCTEEV